MCFAEVHFLKHLQVHGLHDSQDLPKGSCDSRSKALPALKRLALMDAAKAAQLAPEVVQMRLLQEEREREAMQEKVNRCCAF